MNDGQEAKQHLAQLILQKQVQAEVEDVDRYGRGVARIVFQGRDINFAQVESGHAWHYAQYAQKNQSKAEFARYSQAEQAARRQKQGLWHSSQPTPPWEWRAARREPE